MMSPWITVGALNLGSHLGKLIHLAASVESPIVISAGFPSSVVIVSNINNQHPGRQGAFLGVTLGFTRFNVRATMD